MVAQKVTDEEIIKAFRGLYSGGLAQKRRDAGDQNAMPPWAETYWLGKQVVKCPMDLWVYQEIIVETRPEVLLETGTSGGGSAFFFAALFDLLGVGHVVTVDKDAYPHLWGNHPRITYLVGDSVDASTVRTMLEHVAGRRTMVSLDSLHTYEHVSKELAVYGPVVTPGCYLVVEDTNVDEQWGVKAAKQAAIDFIDAHFVIDKSREKHLLTSNLWLRRIA